MRILYLMLIVSLSLNTNSFCQEKSYIGFFGAMTFDKLRINDQGGVLESAINQSYSYGGLIGQGFNDHFVLETGFYLKYYFSGFVFSDVEPRIHTTGTSFNTFQVPLRLKTVLPLFNRKILVIPLAGVSFSLNRDYDFELANGLSWHMTSNDFYYTSYVEDVSLSRVFALAEAGINIDFRISGDLYFSTQFSYFGGLQKVTQVDYEYQVNNGAIGSTRANGYGTYFHYGVGLNYAISNVFKNK